MADTGKQSPLGVNVLGSLLQNIGFWINPTAESYMGKNKLTDPPVGGNGDYEFGKICEDTCLKWVTYSIHDGFQRGAPRFPDNEVPSPPTKYTLTASTYNNLVTIGQSRIPALGNSPPPTWETTDPGNVWVNQHPDYYSTNLAGSPANSGYGFYNWVAKFDDNWPPDRDAAYKNEGQLASWYPFLATAGGQVVPNRAITMWGWVRCIPLQAWNEFNWNGKTVLQTDVTPSGSPEYQYFSDSFASCDSFKNYSNQAIYAIEDSKTFLKGTYSNQDDLISADVAGVSLSSRAFGQDLINLGNAIDFEYVSVFGLPSSVLQILKKYNALTQPVILSLLASGLSQNEIEAISTGNITPSKEQEQKIYASYLIIVNTDLEEIKTILNCRTKGMTSLADLVSVKKMFPLSFTTLTVPIYNTAPGPTNSKTYYLLFIAQELNPQLVTPRIKEIVGEIVPPMQPPIVIEPPPAPPPAPPAPPIILPELPSIPAPDPVPPVSTVLPPPLVPTPLPRSGGGGCVVLESYIPLIETDQKHNGKEITNAWMVESGMKISLGTDDLQIIEGRIVKTLNDYQPCVRITTVDGISLVCSTTAPILTKDDGFVPSIEVYGKRVAVMRDGRTWFDEVVGLEDVGMKFVRVIDTGNNSFWAGEKPGSFMLHHNAIINEQFEMDKK
jgi:hypothetical protein